MGVCFISIVACFTPLKTFFCSTPYPITGTCLFSKTTVFLASLIILFVSASCPILVTGTYLFSVNACLTSLTAILDCSTFCPITGGYLFSKTIACLILLLLMMLGSTCCCPLMSVCCSFSTKFLTLDNSFLDFSGKTAPLWWSS